MLHICDYMIIQRDEDGFGRALFSGTVTNPDEGAVVVRVLDENDNTMVVPWQACTVADGKFQIELTIPEGGLYRVEARKISQQVPLCVQRYDWGGLIACASHVGVGDVFVLTGQSNMSGYGKDPAYDPPQMGVHLYDNSGHWVLATHPLNSVPNPIYCNNDDSSGTSPGLSFGKTMQRKLGVPIGLISASKGGRALEDWEPSLEEHDLYDAMIAKIEAVGGCKAILWYQGCTDTEDDTAAETYYDRFTKAIAQWRAVIGHKPVLICQINRHAWKGRDLERNWGLIREAQRRAAMHIPDVYIIPTADLYTIDGIHNASASCIVVGERAASTMLHCVYGKRGVIAPNVQRVEQVDARTVLLVFQTEFTLRTMDDLAHGLNIEDDQGMMDCVKATVCPRGILVTAPRDIGENPRFHAYWQRESAAFMIRDNHGMPMIACYNIPIEKNIL